MGYRHWGHKKSDTSEPLTVSLSYPKRRKGYREFCTIAEIIEENVEQFSTLIPRPFKINLVFRGRPEYAEEKDKVSLAY